MFGVPGRAAKSSISLLSRKPAPATVTADPYQPLMVVVSATALPRPSVTEKWVVCRLSARAGRPDTSRDGVARSVEIDARSAALNAGDRSSRLIEGDEIGIAEHFVAHGERAPHALGHQMHGLRGVPPEAGEIVRGQLSGNQREREAARGGRRHRDHLVPAVLERDRRAPFRLVTLQIARGDDSLPALHFRHEQIRGLALVEPVPPALGDAAQRAGEIGVLEARARRERTALRHVQRGRRGKAGQSIGLGLDDGRGVLVHLEAVLGEANRRRDEARPRLCDPSF